MGCVDCVDSDDVRRPDQDTNSPSELSLEGGNMRLSPPDLGACQVERKKRKQTNAEKNNYRKRLFQEHIASFASLSS